MITLIFILIGAVVGFTAISILGWVLFFMVDLIDTIIKAIFGLE